MKDGTLDYEQLYRDFYGKVMGFVLGHIKNPSDAENLCADVFVKVGQKLDSFQPDKASLSKWIYTITRNTVIDAWRTRKESVDLSDELALASEQDLEADFLRQELLERLASALEELSQEEQDILVMRYYQGFTLQKISRLMNLSYGVTKLRHSAALRFLRKKLV